MRTTELAHHSPHTVLTVCRFYLGHPEPRGEPVTPAAVDRIRSLEASHTVEE